MYELGYLLQPTVLLMLKFLFVLFFCIAFLLDAQAQELMALESKKDTPDDEFEFEFSNLSFGIQGSFFKPENETKSIDGEVINDSQSMFLGQGLELGYQYTDALAFRFSIRDLPFESTTVTGEEDNKLMTSFELINRFDEFPVYVVGGINYLNDGKSSIFINFGPGIRFDFNKHFYSYAESKMNFSLTGGSSSFSINVGLVYRFGQASAEIIRTDKDITADKNDLTRDSKVAELLIAKEDVSDITAADVDVTDSLATTTMVASASEKEVRAAVVVAKALATPPGVLTESVLAENALAEDELVAMSQSAASSEQLTPTAVITSITPFSGCISQQELLSGKEQLIYFQQDEMRLSVSNVKHIDCLANTLMKHLNARLYIDGYVSASDNTDDGLLLAYRRALVVQEYLLATYGFKENRLIVVRHSDVADFDSTKQTDSNQGNRRVGYHIELID